MLYSSQPKLGLGRSLPILIIVTIVMNKIVLFQNWVYHLLGLPIATAFISVLTWLQWSLLKQICKIGQKFSEGVTRVGSGGMCVCRTPKFGRIVPLFEQCEDSMTYFWLVIWNWIRIWDWWFVFTSESNIMTWECWYICIDERKPSFARCRSFLNVSAQFRWKLTVMCRMNSKSIMTWKCWCMCNNEKDSHPCILKKLFECECSVQKETDSNMQDELQPDSLILVHRWSRSMSWQEI